MRILAFHPQPNPACAAARAGAVAASAILLLIFTVALAKAQGAHEEKGQLFDGPGGKLYYEVVGAGTGTPLIAVNGGPGFDHTYFHTSPSWDALGKNRRIIFYDQRQRPLRAAKTRTILHTRRSNRRPRSSPRTSWLREDGSSRKFLGRVSGNGLRCALSRTPQAFNFGGFGRS